MPRPSPTTLKPSIPTNTQRRMRKQLLEAAARLLKAGAAPSMDEIAAEAMVSRATAYRYFPNVEALLVEAPIDEAVPDPCEFFANDLSKDPIARLDRAEAMLHGVCYRNARALRAMLAASLQHSVQDGIPALPRRQNRRTGLIETALGPARSELTPAAHRRLSAALALVFGTESMIVFTDILGLDDKSARDIKRWMIRSLVTSALVDPAGSGRYAPARSGT